MIPISILVPIGRDHLILFHDEIVLHSHGRDGLEYRCWGLRRECLDQVVLVSYDSTLDRR